MSRTLLLLPLFVLACAGKTDPGPTEPATRTDGPSAIDPPSTAEEEIGQDGADKAQAEEAKAEEAKAEAPAKDLTAVLEAQANAKTFLELISTTDLAKQLRSTDGAGFTLLVPTDDAFAKVPKATLDKLKKNPAELERVLKYHIITGTNDVGKLGNFRTAPTALGKDVDVKVEESEVKIGGARLLENDIKASNGYVHMIDKVLMPKK